MDSEEHSITPKNELSDFLFYKSPNGEVKVEVVLGDETVWLTQKLICKLFDISKATVSEHLTNIYSEGELDRAATVRKFRTVQLEGKRTVERSLEHYNLDAIISVGYRINSSKATQFRIWATQLLKEYIIKGFAMDDERLKNGRFFGKDYFRELLERVRSIRASERRIYQQITDIFAECSIDYDPKSLTTRDFYAHVQDKFHFAITGQTAAEIVFTKADASKPLMGLQTYQNAPDGRVLKSDATVGKNYLSEDEIKKLERTISSFFDYIEGIIERRQEFTMQGFAESVNKFLAFNEYKVLDGYGSITRTLANSKASDEYDKFNKIQKIESDFDKTLKKLEQMKQTDDAPESK
jgi:hypothetical protein